MSVADGDKDELKKDYSRGHVPSSLVYGPVLSRRFGKSLGVSMSLTHGISCNWRCPYCQLGEQEYLAKPAFVSREALCEELNDAVRGFDVDALDVICVSGSGEPLDHPDVKNIFQDIDDCARAVGAQVVVLSNGDALSNALMSYDVIPDDWRVYFKWDTVSRSGTWRSMSVQQKAQRKSALQSVAQLRIQSMVFALADQSADWHEARMENWCQSIGEIAPYEVHIMSLERDAPRFDLVQYSHEQLEGIAKRLRLHTDATVRVF